jgi:hypothetical protein
MVKAFRGRNKNLKCKMLNSLINHVWNNQLRSPFKSPDWPGIKSYSLELEIYPHKLDASS